MTSTQRFWLLGVCICVGCFLMVFPLFLQDDAFSFELTITYGNVVQAFATVITGIIVAAFFARLTQADRAEKDTLFKMLSALLPLADEYDTKKDAGNFTEINNIMMRLSLAAKCVVDVLKDLDYEPSVKATADLVSDVQELWDYATDSPVEGSSDGQSGSENGNEIKGGILRLSDKKRALLDVKVRQLKNRVYKAQICLNKA